MVTFWLSCLWHTHPQHQLLMAPRGDRFRGQSSWSRQSAQSKGGGWALNPVLWFPGRILLPQADCRDRSIFSPADLRRP
ncbi:hypothetical protein AVDCRST_MAG94-4708 [uncultured Leptolyngbya sp.]|uniref:Uncharacterized protein n=1 Tax=uncultured Leptolyngbya sp. TaxID=332963 RepID=A0A6J4N8X5_9CYAN|nr:hypothetical protein AVDCRST_MAG94-4708 [uncultured Leptolyngbya sp.]